MILFNIALNTFLYAVKDHSDGERGNPTYHFLG